MDQLQLLWDYQQADIEVDRMETSIKRSATRQKLIKYRDFLVEQQNIIKRIESELTNMIDRIEALKDAVSRTEEQLKVLQTKMEKEPADNSETIHSFITDAQRLMSNINSYDQEIRHIRNDANDRDRQQREVTIRAAKAKGEFDKLKAEYDGEYAGQMKELSALRSALAEKGKGIEPAFLEKYKTIKLHSMPPMARLIGDQCGGCNMSLPSVVVRNIRAGKEVECETCGRMIINS